MKMLGAVLAFSVLAATDASAQAVISGPYQCVQNCQGPGLANVTQNGWDLNLVNEAGAPSRAWIDYPGHFWADYYNMGAVYSPDGVRIQFDNGTVWVHYVPPPPPPPPPDATAITPIPFKDREALSGSSRRSFGPGWLSVAPGGRSANVLAYKKGPLVRAAHLVPAGGAGLN